MEEVARIVEASVREARNKGRSYIMFIHGWSTSGIGKTTARSQVRSFMRSEAATPLIDRTRCLQHESVFVAKLKPGADKLGIVTIPHQLPLRPIMILIGVEKPLYLWFSARSIRMGACIRKS
jgi:hypothetical protein